MNHAKDKVSMTDFKRDLSKIIRSSEDRPVAIFRKDKLKAYLFSVKAYETLINLIDDT